MSGSQKALKVISIIIIIISILMIIGGVMSAGGGALLTADEIGNATALSAGIDPTLYGGDAAMTLAEVGSLTVILGIFIVVLGLVKLFVGIFGLRGANNPAKIGVFRVIALIGVVLAIIDIAYIVITGAYGMISPALVINVVLVIICFVLSGNIKKQAVVR